MTSAEPGTPFKAAAIASELLDDVVQVSAQDAYPYGRVDSGCQHVDAILDRQGPDVGPAGHLHGPIQIAAEADQVGAILLPQDQAAGKGVRLLVLNRVQLRVRRDAGSRGRMPSAMFMRMTGRQSRLATRLPHLLLIGGQFGIED